MRHNTLAILGGLALMLGSAQLAAACEACGSLTGCRKDCSAAWSGYCGEGCACGRKGCGRKGGSLKDRISAIQKGSKTTCQKGTSCQKVATTIQKGASCQKAGCACQKGASCQKAGGSCQKAGCACQKGAKSCGKGCGGCRKGCGLFGKHRGGCGCGDECGGCGAGGRGRGGQRVGMHCGPMPQTCYQPRYGCYFGGNRHMARYPAFHGYYYRRPYNYRNLFDYPWHAGLHEPTSLFSYNVPPEEREDDADPGFDNGNVSSPEDLESIVPPLPESARRTVPSDQRFGTAGRANILNAKFQR